MTTKSVDKDGKTSVTGSRDLKGSQAYTKEFGFAILDLWKNAEPLQPLEPKLSQVEIPNFWIHQSKPDRWEDANLSEVFQYLATK